METYKTFFLFFSLDINEYCMKFWDQVLQTVVQLIVGEKGEIFLYSIMKIRSKIIGRRAVKIPKVTLGEL